MELIVYIGHTSIIIEKLRHTTELSNILKKFLFNLFDYTYDRKLKKYVRDKAYFTTKSRYNDEIHDLIFIPRNYKDELLKHLDAHKIEYKLDSIKDIKPPKIKTMKMAPHMKDKPHQTPAIEYLLEIDKGIRCLSIQTGCLAGGNLIKLNAQSQPIPLGKLYHKLKNSADEFQTRSLDKDLIIWNTINEVYYSGIQEVYKLFLNNGMWVECTWDHLIYTDEGWVEANLCVNKNVAYEDEQGNLQYSKCWHFAYVGEEATFDIACKYPNDNFVANNIVVHNSGKTYCGTKGAMLKQEPFLVLSSGLVNQWKKSIISQTSLTEDDIYVIKGNESIKKLMEMEKIYPCVIASLETFRNFAQKKKEYQGFEFSVQEFCTKCGFGTKIVDECHSNFHAIVSIDLVLNIGLNIYLSATYLRNNQSTNKIFNRIFPIEIRYGEKDYKQYADIKVYGYNSFVPEKYANLYGVYSHYNYESYLLKHQKGVYWFCHHLLKKIMDDRYIRIKKPGQRLLILMGKIDNIHKVIAELKNIYPDLTILPFTKDHGEENLNADIIVSTIGSAGEGRDIKDLVSCILTVSIKAPGQLKQILGRLRELLDGSQVYFSDIFNELSATHRRHKDDRSFLYRMLGKFYSEGKI